MPLGVVLNRGDSGANVHELHEQLAAIGSVVDPGERDTSNFGPSTLAAVRDFRERYGLPAGGSLDLSTGRVMHVASAFAASGDPGPLRAAVREARPAASDVSQPQEVYWLARYATLAGDYEAARGIAALARDHADVKGILDPILELPVPAAPEPVPPDPGLPYPENFYAYRYDLYPSGLDSMQEQVARVGQPPRSPNQVYPASGTVGAEIIQAAVNWFEAVRQWQIGNAAFSRRNYGSAQTAYDACQAAVCEYFGKAYSIALGTGTRTEQLAVLIKHVAKEEAAWTPIWSRIRWRRGLLSLQELRSWDWPALRPTLHVMRQFDPAPLHGQLPPLPDHPLGFLQQYFRRGEFGSDPATLALRQRDLEAPLLTLAFVLVPLARAEANRARRQFDAAIRDLRWVLNSIVVRTTPASPSGEPRRQIRARLACEFIELPFARLLLAETLLDQADAEYKARINAEPPPAPDVAEYQGLKAAQTYLAVKAAFAKEGAYVARVDASRERLAQQVQGRLDAGDTRGQEFQLLGKDILVPTLVSFTSTLPGLDRRAKAHEPLLKFIPPEGQSVMRETNPRVYAALLAAAARLEQLRAGFNYLGYLDSYVPPWRFPYLLERARYFAEHAKNAQREYLNFLGNAEREDFQELSASQALEMEKSNLRIETARVAQVGLELAAAHQSTKLAELTAEDAQKKLAAFRAFDKYADGLFGTFGEREGVELVSGGIRVAFGPLGDAAGVVERGFAAAGDFYTQGAVSSRKHVLVANAQRGVEQYNLQLAEAEARQAARVARAQMAVANAGLVVAGLQRQAALLRHEFAVQNLDFLRNRVLSSEHWYRLAVAVRGISETYLRYAVELAFLAEQAYEFEADKRINVIRFDYDLSEVGDYLAADFLMRDLDTLEQDLVVTQRERQQQVRYVLSLARESPEALQELRDGSRTTFSLRLEQIEQRFPGLHNARIGSVDVLPIALMDSSRFSLELTHLGISQVRLKAQADAPSGTPSSSPLNTNDLPVAAGGWLAELQQVWPVKLLVTKPETTIFSGLTRQDASAVFPLATVNQRHAFEALGAAAAWQVDFAARDNQVVSGTLADLLVTFTLSGYHDGELRSAIDRARRPPSAVTSWLSGRTIFPDALYEANRSGRMVWRVTRDLLTLTDTLGAVRNAAVLLLPTPGRSNDFGRLSSVWDVHIRITDTLDLEVRSELPEITYTLGGVANPLALTVAARLPAGADASWDFDDGSTRQTGAVQQHTYAKPGRYTVSCRIVRAGRLSEFRGDVVVSRTHPESMRAPVTAFPSLRREQSGSDIPAGHTRVVGTINAPAADPVNASWRLAENRQVKGNTATFDLAPGDYIVRVAAARRLRARLYCTQRHLTEPSFEFDGLALASNRRFDVTGAETTGAGGNPPANPVASHLFAPGALSPVDEWTVEIPLADNAFLRSVGPTDVEQYTLNEIQDMVLVLEYAATARRA